MPPVSDYLEEYKMSFLYVVLAIIIIVLAFKFNVLLGLAILAAIALWSVYHYIPDYYAMKGNKAFAAGDDETAKLWYKKAYDTGRTKVKLKTSYAYLLMRTGDYDGAEKVLDPIVRVKALAPEKKNPAKMQRCMVYYKQGRLDEAIDDAMEIYNSGFRNSNLYGMIGLFKLLRCDDIDETLAICKEAYEYNSDNRDIADNLALCYYNMGNYSEAEKISDKLVGEQDGFVEAYYHGAQIAQKLGKYDKVREYLNKIDGCKRSNLTTVSEDEIEQLKKEVEDENTAR